MGKHMSELLELWKKHRDEINALRKRCKHPKKDIIIRQDNACCGRGCLYSSIHVVCINCGTKKIMFRQDDKEFKIKPLKTLKRQKGIKDQRLDCYVEFDWELKD
jgi:hypothetical protein